MGLRARFATGSSDAAAAACERRERRVGGSAAPPPGQLIGGSANAVDSAGATFRRDTVAAALSIAVLAMVAAALVESFAVPATTFLAFFAATTTAFFAFRAFAAAACAFRLASPFFFGRTSSGASTTSYDALDDRIKLGLPGIAVRSVWSSKWTSNRPG